ncbi:hypothetical protein CSKR_109802 [Clonorchis sinensis]|uniref:Nostrin n=1 Tax=Clonorchis sinensis TaxID=79923 RepID=A0A8T1LX89_CLOSI|nr:hypothetical protein CSKR_109802 [Clonorchis sinensis]
MEAFSNGLSSAAHRWGFDIQLNEHKRATEFTQTLVQIFQEKSELQSTYARGLSRLSVRLRDALGSAYEGSVHNSFLRVVSALETEAKLHQQFASGLADGLLQPWTQLVENLNKSRKPLKVEISKVTNKFLTLFSTELRTRKKLYLAYKTCERSLHARSQRTHSPLKPTDVRLGNGDVECKTDGLASLHTGRLCSPSRVSAAPRRMPYSFRSQSPNPGTQAYQTERTSTLDSRISRHHSERSATLPSRSGSAFSTDRGSHSSADKADSLVEKTKAVCLATLIDHYRTCMATEDCRVEWHTTLLKSIQNLRILERQRLDALVKGLNVYKNLFDQSIVSIQTALSDLTAAVKSADPSADLDLFRKRSQLATADLTKVPNSPTPEQPFYDNPTLKSAVGCSQQRLLEVPGEHLIFNLQTSSSTLSTGVDSQTSKQVNNAFANHQGEVLPATNSAQSIPSRLRESLTRECLFTQLEMLSKEVVKERRTKQGLTNLVQVYAREPAYSDEPTYCEARRRLYVSRVRLTYLTNCRQKSIYSLMCLLSAPGSQSAPDLLPKHIYAEALVRAGFYNLPWISSISPTPGSNSSLPPSAVRWIPLPDLDEETSFRRLSRPLEWPPFTASDAPCEDLNEGLFEWELERLVQRDMEEQTAISAFTGELYWENIDLIDGDTVEDSSLSSVKNGIKEGISSPLMLRRNSNPQFKKSSEISNFGANDSLLKKTGLTKRLTTEHNVPNRYSSRPSKDIDHSVPSVTDSLTDKANKPVVHDNRSKFLGGSRFRGISIGRNNTTSSKSEANQTSSPPVSPNSFGSSVTSPISVQLSLPSDASSHELKQPTSSRSSFWLRTRLFSRKHSEKEASPSSTHCKQDTDNEHTNLLKLSSDETASNDVLKPMTVLDKSLWPSTISLHCLGWAKVERDYKARTSQELSLQAGDIVSIYRKDNELWWFGELNGTKGRFPVSHVEEF